MDINDILLDLEVINQVKENDKLAVNIIPGKKTLIVDNYSYFSSIKRWYYKYNREDVISYLEELLMKIENASNIINNGNTFTFETIKFITPGIPIFISFSKNFLTINFSLILHKFYKNV